MTTESTGYEAPELVALGSLTELTQGVAGNSTDNTIIGSA